MSVMRVGVGTHMHKGLFWKVLCLVSVYVVFSVLCLFSLKMHYMEIELFLFVSIL